MDENRTSSIVGVLRDPKIIFTAIIAPIFVALFVMWVGSFGLFGDGDEGSEKPKVPHVIVKRLILPDEGPYTGESAELKVPVFNEGTGTALDCRVRAYKDGLLDPIKYGFDPVAVSRPFNLRVRGGHTATVYTASGRSGTVYGYHSCGM